MKKRHLGGVFCKGETVESIMRLIDADIEKSVYDLMEVIVIRRDGEGEFDEPVLDFLRICRKLY